MDLSQNWIFLSHDTRSSREALARKTELKRQKGDGWNVFLSSDWESLRVGECWFEGVLRAVECSTEFEALICHGDTFRNLWVNFELGFALGSRALNADLQNLGFQRISTRVASSLTADSLRVATPLADWSRFDNAPLPHSEPSRIYLTHTIPMGNEAGILADMIRYVGGDEIHVETRANVWGRTGVGACRCLATVAAVKACDAFFAFVDRPWDAHSPWLNFEVGVSLGLKKPPHILISGGVGLNESDIPFPLRGIFWIGTGDLNRWTTIFKSLGLTCGMNDRRLLEDFGWFFRQRNNNSIERASILPRGYGRPDFGHVNRFGPSPGVQGVQD